jgi:hypothetical protein
VIRELVGKECFDSRECFENDASTDSTSDESLYYQWKVVRSKSVPQSVAAPPPPTSPTGRRRDGGSPSEQRDMYATM